MQAVKLHVFSAETIDQGIEVMMGVSAEKIHKKLKAKLKELAAE